MQRCLRVAWAIFGLALLAGWTNAGHSAPADRDLSHMQDLIRQAESLAAIPQVRQNMSTQDLDWVTQTTAAARQALTDKQYAKAWGLLTDWKFWILTHEKMPGYCPAQRWLVAGPFPEGASDAERVAITGWAWPGEIWQPSQTVLEQGWNRLEAKINLKDQDALLAATSIYTASNQTVMLRFQSRDALSVWLNGQRLDTGKQNKINPDFHLNLARGWNRLLVKAVRTGPEWGFTYKLTDSAGAPCYALETDPAVVTVGDCSVRIQGPVVRGIWWQGQEIMQSQYMIFSGADKIKRQNFNVNLCDFIGNKNNVIAPMRLSRDPAGGIRLTWEGDVPGTEGQVALNEQVRVASNRVVCVYRYKTLRDLYPCFQTKDPTRVFDRAKASEIYDRLFYWTFESHSPWLWNTKAEVETRGKAKQAQNIPTREAGKSATLAAQAFEAPRWITFATPAGPVAISFATERLPEQFSLYVQTRTSKAGQPFWFFGLTDHATGKQDILPAGYTNTMTGAFTFGDDVAKERAACNW